MALTSSNAPIKLRDIVPTRGMIYQAGDRVTHQIDRDWQVTIALESANCKLTSDGLEQAFVTMFRIARTIFIDGRLLRHNLWDMFEGVRRKLSWARMLPAAVFAECFLCLVEARCVWEQVPWRTASETEKHGPLVQELVRFREAVDEQEQLEPRGSSSNQYNSWILTNAVLHNTPVGGLDADDENEEDKDVLAYWDRYEGITVPQRYNYAIE